MGVVFFPRTHSSKEPHFTKPNIALGPMLLFKDVCILEGNWVIVLFVITKYLQGIDIFERLPWCLIMNAPNTPGRIIFGPHLAVALFQLVSRYSGTNHVGEIHRQVDVMCAIVCHFIWDAIINRSDNCKRRGAIHRLADTGCCLGTKRFPPLILVYSSC